MKTNFKRLILLMPALLLLSHCGNNRGTTIVNNPTDQITIGQLTGDGRSTVTIPLAIFGGSDDDVEEATIDIYINATARTTGMSAFTYYSSDDQVVTFVLTSLNDGDEIRLIIHLAAGTSAVYSGVVSDTADTYTESGWTELSSGADFLTNGNGIAVDSSGNSYIAGSTTGDLDGESLTGDIDAFVIKYNSSGIKQWTSLLGVAGENTEANGIAADSDGNTYITGYTAGDLDGETLTGTNDVFITKYDTSGTLQWTRLLGVAGATTAGTGIAVDSDGNCYITGSTDGDLDGETLTGTSDVFVIKYDTAGTKQWTSLLGVSGKITQGEGIAVDSSGNSYVAGATTGDLDGQSLTGDRDIFVVKYNSSGTKQWTRLSGVTGADSVGLGIAVSSSGNSYVIGYTDGELDGESLTGAFDVFVMKYNSSGTKQWTRLSGGSNFTRGNGIAVDSSGNSFATGYTNGDLDGESLTGSEDAFVIKYNDSGVKQSTTLLGVSGESTRGNGIALDTSGVSYVVGETHGDLSGESLVGDGGVFVTTELNP